MVAWEKQVFPGGDKALFKFLSENIIYPQEAAEVGAKGRVVVKIRVENDGTISDIKVARSVHPALDKEAIRVVSIMPKWNRGHADSPAVTYLLPINFDLDETVIDEESINDEPISCDSVDVEPTFPGGKKAMYEFIAENFNFPPSTIDYPKHIKINASFIVEKDGSITNIVTDKVSVHPELCHELIRVINLMPKWEPGKNKGEVVRTCYIFPLSMQIE
ncbi:MAG: energy transducer TonB [Muribaculaceae bacterium]|nr:energy transducer TonB [Muribaculaceae bacterium]